MRGATFIRLGLWLIVAAVALAGLYPEAFPDAAESEASISSTPATKVVIAGGVLIAFGVLVDLIPQSRPPCRQCGRRAAPGGVLCPTHKGELAAAARRAPNYTSGRSDAA